MSIVMTVLSVTWIQSDGLIIIVIVIILVTFTVTIRVMFDKKVTSEV